MHTATSYFKFRRFCGKIYAGLLNWHVDFWTADTRDPCRLPGNGTYG